MISKWFNKWWYKYLFAKKADKDISWYIVLWCRLRNHPDGSIWYSNKYEPDMRCKNCWDNLG